MATALSTHAASVIPGSCAAPQMTWRVPTKRYYVARRLAAVACRSRCGRRTSPTTSYALSIGRSCRHLRQGCAMHAHSKHRPRGTRARIQVVHGLHVTQAGWSHTHLQTAIASLPRSLHGSLASRCAAQSQPFTFLKYMSMEALPWRRREQLRLHRRAKNAPDGDYHPPKYGVAVGPSDFRHVGEVHAVHPWRWGEEARGCAVAARAHLR